ncbi:hypothetical protein ACFLS7_03750 [Bacteroidota bacterium]
MKPTYKITLPIALLSFLLIFSSGCRKELIMVDPAPPTIENPLEVEVSNSFDWKTTRDITLEIAGVTLPVSISNTLQVKSTDEKKVYLKKQLFMNQDYSIKFTIPAYEAVVLVTYGSIRQVIDVAPDVIYFNYFPAE